MLDISEVAETIYQNTLSQQLFWGHKSIVVIGDNSSGKTSLIKKVLDKAIKNNNNEFYYIDSCNMQVIDKISEQSDIEFSYNGFDVLSILKTRRDDDYFAKDDYFNPKYKGGTVIFSELKNNMEKYDELLKKFMPWTLSIGSLVKENSLLNGVETIFIDDENNPNGRNDIENISHSEAAQLRIIMEVNNAFENNCKLVIIDEFDSYFDPANMVGFLEKLQLIYPSLRFMAVIHDFSLLVRLNKMTAVVYNNDKTAPAEIFHLDCDDITEIGQVHKIRARYIGSPNYEEILLSECIASVVKCGSLTDEYIDKFRLIEREKLNAKEKILFDYIVEYKHD